MTGFSLGGGFSTPTNSTTTTFTSSGTFIPKSTSTMAFVTVTVSYTHLTLPTNREV